MSAKRCVSARGRSFGKEVNARYDLVWTPLCGSQDGCVVGLPHSQRPLGLQLPVHDPAIGVTSQQARVALQDLDAVDVCSVATEDVGGLGGVALLLTLANVKRHAIFPGSGWYVI